MSGCGRAVCAALVTMVFLAASALAQAQQGQPKEQPAMPPELHVVGNQLQTPDGKKVWLQGVNVPSMEWSDKGENVLESIATAIDDWHANVIRLPLSQDRWFGKTDAQKDGGEAYRALIDQAVALCAGKKAYIVIDLHWSDANVWGKYMAQHSMPDANSVTFWQDAAKRYANHPAVLFDLYNEPRNVSWEVWRNGGEVKDKSGAEVLTYQTIGLQAMLEEVRKTGAKNVVAAGGLDWAYDLTGVLKGFALEDKAGHGIMYSAHIYPWKKQWDLRVGQIAEKYPILVGEVGCEPGGKNENPYTWGPDMLGYIQKHQLNWTAWSFHTGASPRVLQDWKYTPTPYWGAFVRSALLGVQFQSSKTR